MAAQDDAELLALTAGGDRSVRGVLPPATRTDRRGEDVLARVGCGWPWRPAAYPRECEGVVGPGGSAIPALRSRLSGEGRCRASGCRQDRHRGGCEPHRGGDRRSDGELRWLASEYPFTDRRGSDDCGADRPAGRIDRVDWMARRRAGHPLSREQRQWPTMPDNHGRAEQARDGLTSHPRPSSNPKAPCPGQGPPCGSRWRLRRSLAGLRCRR